MNLIVELAIITLKNLFIILSSSFQFMDSCDYTGSTRIIQFCFFFNTSLLEYNCFTMLCQFLLYNKVNLQYAYMHPHIPSLLSLPPTLPITPLQVGAKHQADCSVLCCSFPLTIYFTFGSVYMSMPLSHFATASPPFPPLCPHVRSLSTSLFLPYKQVHLYHFPRFHTYA